jgi:hypothetical protein
MIRFLENYSLKAHNTFGVDVNAKYFFEFTEMDDLVVFLQSNQTWKSEKLIVLGEGSNTLFVEQNKKHVPVSYGMMSRNSVELYYEELVQHKTNKKVWKKDGISVITSDDNILELSLLFRNVWIKMLPNNDIIKVIKLHKSHLQSVSIMAPKKKYDEYVTKFVQAGLVRIKKSDELSEVILGESHDGMYPLRLYSRVVEIYKK